MQAFEKEKTPLPTLQASVVMIDNYDSFTYNLVQYLQEIGATVSIFRNDELSAEDVMQKQADAVILSPGPSSPENAGICMDLVKLAFQRKKKLFGVCLGHQAIGAALGGKISVMADPLHGKTSQVLHSGLGVLRGLPSPFTCARYHSLIVDEAGLPDEFVITSKDDEGIIMGLQCKSAPIEGVQFHPESVLTEYGRTMLANFLSA